MKKMSTKKLALHKQTLKQLNDKNLTSAAGGRPPESGLSACYCETDLCSNFVIIC